MFGVLKQNKKSIEKPGKTIWTILDILRAKTELGRKAMVVKCEQDILGELNRMMGAFEGEALKAANGGFNRAYFRTEKFFFLNSEYQELAVRFDTALQEKYKCKFTVRGNPAEIVVEW
jgi:hypothetical protein